MVSHRIAMVRSATALTYLQKPMFQSDSSPFDPSPRHYWQSRDSASPTRTNAENRDPRDQSPSPAKRSSIENLKRASRVKNSNMFAREQKQEYDPTSSPMVERPLATGRPLLAQAHANAFSDLGNGILPNQDGAGSTSPARSPSKLAGRASMPDPVSSPNKGHSSPAKSSLSSKNKFPQSQAFDPENGVWSDEEDSFTERQLPPGKSLHRHAKSVTFDVAPPQVNEYEMTTPDPSSVASGSRDGSHESSEDEDDESFDRGSSIERDESFDASLEDTEKTPVVLPEEWRFMSPAAADDELTVRVENPFGGDRSSPAPTTEASSAVDARPSPARTDSVNSNGERRPLPPLPAASATIPSHTRSNSKNSLSATAERIDRSQRPAASPPFPAMITKAEIQGMGGCSVSIENRLKLMMLDDDAEAKSPAKEQRERRLRRGSPVRSPDFQENREEVHKCVEESDGADLADYKIAPRISRESILRKVKKRSRDSEVEEEESSFVLGSQYGTNIANIDPDTPLPSTEYADEQESEIKREPGEEHEVDLYSIPDLYSQHIQAESFITAMEKLEAIKQSRAEAALEDDDDESHYSTDLKNEAPKSEQLEGLDEEDAPPTPKAVIVNEKSKGLEQKASHRMSLPQFAALLGEQDFDFGMESFMTNVQLAEGDPEYLELPSASSWTPSHPLNQAPKKDMSVIQPELERPMTPESQPEPPKIPGQHHDSPDEPRTPDSVVRHQMVKSPPPESPGIPEPVATIKASSSKLKTRQSATPADVQAMAEVRRQVSGEVPPVPKIPEGMLSRPSVVTETDEPLIENTAKSHPAQSSVTITNVKPMKRKSSLVTLDFPMDGAEEGLGIESEFDRLLEAQKVQYHFSNSYSNLIPRSPYGGKGPEIQNNSTLRDCYANFSRRPQKGYLMRQNTKVVVASSASLESASEKKSGEDISDIRGTRSAGNSPRKASQTQTWTTEPWNGKVRRKSIRKSGGVPSKTTSGPAPPLPGQHSNVASGLNSVAEDEAVSNTDEIGDDGERGRLFVKVVRVKDLSLPLPKGKLHTNKYRNSQRLTSPR